MYAFLFQISTGNVVRYKLYGTDGHKREYLFESNEIKIQFVTSQWFSNNRGFNLTWIGKCTIQFTIAATLSINRYLFV